MKENIRTACGSVLTAGLRAGAEGLVRFRSWKYQPNIVSEEADTEVEDDEVTHGETATAELILHKPAIECVKGA